MCYNTSEETLSVLKYVQALYMYYIYAEYKSHFSVIFENISGGSRIWQRG